MDGLNLIHYIGNLGLVAVLLAKGLVVRPIRNLALLATVEHHLTGGARHEAVLGAFSLVAARAVR